MKVKFTLGGDLAENSRPKASEKSWRKEGPPFEILG